MEQYLIPAKEGASEYIEKKSRFLGLIVPVTTEAEARAQLDAVKKREYDARHNCWAYILHSGQKRYSDDGEPQGTAGQPMLEVLKKRATYKTAAVVTRYFGGIKLGAGGLVSAYTRSVAEALDEADVQKFVYGTKYTVTCGYEMYNVLLQILKNIVSSVLSTDFGNIVSIDIAVPKDGERAFPSVVNDALMGQATVTKGEDGYYIFD